MITTKTIEDFIRDTSAITSQFEQHYNNVFVHIRCYNNNCQVVEECGMTPSLIPATQSDIFSNKTIDRVRIVITGHDQQGVTHRLYDERFRLADTAPGRNTRGDRVSERTTQAPYVQPDGIGLADLDRLTKKIAEDRILRKDHDELQKLVVEQRSQIDQLKADLQKEEKINEKHTSLKQRIEMFIPFAPSIVALLGQASQAGNAVQGLAGLTDAGTPPQQKSIKEDEQTEKVIASIRTLMAASNEPHRQQLEFIIAHFQLNKDLVSHFAQYLENLSRQQVAAQAMEQLQQSKQNEQQQPPEEV